MNKINAHKYGHCRTFNDEYTAKAIQCINTNEPLQAIFKTMLGAATVRCQIHCLTLRVVDPSRGAANDEMMADFHVIDSADAEKRLRAVFNFLLGDGSVDGPLVSFDPATVECDYYEDDRPDLLPTWPYIRLHHTSTHRVVCLPAYDNHFRDLRTGDVDEGHLYYGYENPAVLNRYNYIRSETTEKIMYKVIRAVQMTYDPVRRCLAAVCRSAFHEYLFRGNYMIQTVSLTADTKTGWILRWCMDGCMKEKRMVVSYHKMKDTYTMEVPELKSLFVEIEIDNAMAAKFLTIYLRFASLRYYNNNILMSIKDVDALADSSVAVVKRKAACIQRSIQKMKETH